MSILYKIFNDSGLTALTNYIKTTRAKAVSNEAAIGGLGEDLAGLSGEVVTALDNKQNKLTFDTTPTAGSTNPVTSGGVKSYVDSAAVQSDLSQTDNAATDYVKGVLRTEHLPDGYPYKSEEPILDGTFEFADDGGIYTHQITDENFVYVDGKSYTVIWDGETYQCVATNYSGLPVLGNLAVPHAGADTGEPFVFLISGTNKLIYTADTAATHTVTVCKEFVHPIAEEFLPEIAIENGMVLKNLKTTLPSSEHWTYVTYGNGKFVAIASSSAKAAYSEDGITWNTATLPSYAFWDSITYGNGKFVAVEKNMNPSRAAYSEDGINWTAATTPSSYSWNSVTYGNGKFVTVASQSATAAYSEDGITWTTTTLPKTFLSVTYGNGKFVAVSYSSTAAAYSTDGVTWTATTLPSSAYWQFVTYGNGKFVAVASTSDKAAYSEDGINWTAASLPSSAYWQSVTYGNGKFVAIASSSATSAYSEDGINWAETTMPSTEDWQSVTYGNGKFVAVAQDSTTVAYSRDGINWKTELKLISQNGEDVTADALVALNHQPDLSQTDSTQIDYVKGVIRQESLPEGYPYEIKKIIEWDGDTTGKISVSNTFYKVSDEIPSNDELKESGIMYVTQNANQTSSSFNLGEHWGTFISSGYISSDYAIFEYFVVIRSANTEVSGITFPESGVYFAKINDSIWPTKLDYSIITKLDDKYLDSAYVIDVKVGQSDDGTKATYTLTNGNFNDAYSAYLNKKIIIMQMSGYSGNTLVCTGSPNSNQLNFVQLTKELNCFTIETLQLRSDNTIGVYQENKLAYYGTTPGYYGLSSGLTGYKTKGDGSAYTVRVNGITSLTAGISFVIIPHTVSTSVTATLNVNGLGAKTIRRPISTNTSTTVAPSDAGWLAANKPIQMTYDGTYWVADLPKPYATDIYGTVPVANGGVPECTTADNGKVLKVVNGVPTWVAV